MEMTPALTAASSSSVLTTYRASDVSARWRSVSPTPANTLARTEASGSASAMPTSTVTAARTLPLRIAAAV